MSNEEYISMYTSAFMFLIDMLESVGGLMNTQDYLAINLFFDFTSTAVSFLFVSTIMVLHNGYSSTWPCISREVFPIASYSI